MSRATSTETLPRPSSRSLDTVGASRLSAAKGPAFDKLFLEYMIRHHQGAVTMVEELYRAGGGVEPASDRLAREVNADQQIEIKRMWEMLAKAVGLTPHAGAPRAVMSDL